MKDGFKKGFGFTLGAYAAVFAVFVVARSIVNVDLKDKNTSEKEESKMEEKS